MRITVFTPTYNRAYIIRALYDSLRRQTFRDFEWVVVDDGSTDDTAGLFDRLQSEANDFPIRYVMVPNGGKHRAVNRGVRLAQGELFFIVDSDDYLTDDALEMIDRVERSIGEDERQGYAGVCGLRGFTPEKVIGTTYPGDYLDITTLERERHGITGDKAEVFYSSVLRSYPFPEFPNENFLTEAVVWDRIAHDGKKLRFFNSVVYITEYLEDGYTSNYKSLMTSNPLGEGLFISQRVHFGKYSGREAEIRILSYFNKHLGTMSVKQLCHNLEISRGRYYRYRFARVIRQLLKKTLVGLFGEERFASAKERIGRTRNL